MYPLSIKLPDHTKHIVTQLSVDEFRSALKKGANESKKKSFYLEGISFATDEIKSGQYEVVYEDNDEYIMFHQITFNDLKKES